MIEAPRWTAVIGKLMARATDRATTADVFNAATLAAAKMLHRDDLGRIAPGAKADLLCWRLDSLFMTPVRDPIKNLVYSATPEDLDAVMIDGAWVMRAGKVLTVDEVAACARLQQAADRMWVRIPEGDWAHRGADELSPPTFPPFTS